MIIVDQYLGIPYKPLGTTYKGCDCWGLVRLILKEQFNIELPKQTELAKESFKSGKVGNHNLWAKGWKELEDWKFVNVRDILRMRAIRKDADGYEQLVDNHIGLMIEPKKVIHTSEKCGVLIHRIDVPGFSWRCIKGYRYEN